jgi:DNA-binding transcriptional ArsR family regulator
MKTSQRSQSIDPRLVRALAHPLRVKILEILTERVASPSLLSEELGAGLTHVAYHTRMLNQCDCLELVETAPRRGATEHFYKASPRSFVGDRSWRRVPRSVLGGVSGAALQTFMDKAVAALKAGTLDGREETTLSWMPVELDERGWKEVAAIMNEALDQTLAAQARSRKRLARSKRDRETISAVVAVANFETGGSGRVRKSAE